jgi:hypothetical protein
LVAKTKTLAKRNNTTLFLISYLLK